MSITISLLSTNNKSKTFATCPTLYLMGFFISCDRKLSRKHSIKRNSGCVDKSVQDFTSFIYSEVSAVMTKTIKITQKATNHKPRNKWFDENCASKRREFIQTRNKFLKTKNDANRVLFTRARTQYNRCKRKAKMKFKSSEGKRVCDLAKSKPREFWANINKHIKSRKQSSETLTVDDFFVHFQEVFSGGNPENVPNQDPNERNQETPQQMTDLTDPDLDSEITSDEVKSVIFSLKNAKSPGIDNLAAEVFKTACDLLSPYMVKLFNNVFMSGEYPESWCKGVIVPIYKNKGNIDSANNYRGITLSNVLAKIFSHILLKRINKWSDEQEKNNDNQFGFQKSKSTVDCIFVLSSIISKVINGSTGNKKLYCAFIDYEKAFDKVDRYLLWYKLMQEDVSPRMLKILKSMYKSVKACIKYNNKFSDFMKSDSGLKQGDPLSPILFMFFINDIITCIDTHAEDTISVDDVVLFMLLYADDAVIFAQSAESLQNMLNDIQDYCNTWHLTINTNKTKIMVFEKGRHSYPKIYLNGTELEVVTSFRYLGVELFKNGNWARTQKHIAQHASRALYKLYNLFNQITVPIREQLKLFDSLVGSILSYSAESWGHHEAPDIERVHTKFMRNILGVRKSTNISALYGELGRYPMKISRKIKLIKYWIKLLSRRDTLEFKVYIMLKNDCDNGNNYKGTNWAFHIKHELDICGFSDIWANQLLIDIPFEAIRLRILDQFKQSWYAQIVNSNRLATYGNIKFDFGLETYLQVLSSFKFRRALTRFRISAHSLAIETGRHRNIERNERKCIYCNMNVAESEFHFLLICPLYNDLRIKHLPRYYCRWPTLNKFNQLMGKQSKHTLQHLSHYLYFAFLKRDGNLVF